MYGDKPRDYYFTAFPPGMAVDQELFHNKASVHAKAEQEFKEHQEINAARRDRKKRLGMPVSSGESSEDDMW